MTCPRWQRPTTGNVIEWGKSNQIFDDITRVARAGGQVSIRQNFCAVQTGTTDPLMDAYVIIEQPQRPRCQHHHCSVRHLRQAQ